jgi:hypothetical protein
MVEAPSHAPSLLEAACAGGPHAAALVLGRTFRANMDAAGVRRLFSLAREHAGQSGLPLVVACNAVLSLDGEGSVRGAAGILVRAAGEDQGVVSLAGVELAKWSATLVPTAFWESLERGGAALGGAGLVLAPAGWSIGTLSRRGRRGPVLSCAAEDVPEVAPREVVEALAADPAGHFLRATYC